MRRITTEQDGTERSFRLSHFHPTVVRAFKMVMELDTGARLHTNHYEVHGVVLELLNHKQVIEGWNLTDNMHLRTDLNWLTQIRNNTRRVTLEETEEV